MLGLMVAPVVVLVLTLAALPVFAFGMSFLFGASGTTCAVVVVSGPFCLLALWYFAATWVRDEAHLVRIVGKDRALWVSRADRTLVGGSFAGAVEFCVWNGWDRTKGWFSTTAFGRFAIDSGLPVSRLDEGLVSLSSELWSSMILWLDDSYAMSIMRVGTVLFCVYTAWKVTSRVYAGMARYWFYVFSVGYILLELDPVILNDWVLWFIKRVFIASRGTWSDRFTWLRWRWLCLVSDLVVLQLSVDAAIKRKVSKQLAGDTVTFVAHFREFVVQSVSVVADLKLPEYIRARGWISPSVDVLQASNELMASLGWPVNVDLNDKPDKIGFKFKEWLLCGSDLKTGITNLKARVDEDLNAIFKVDEIYKRTETYATENNEIESLARYFKNPKYDMPDLALDDVWLMLRPIFKDSRLTSFNYIIKMWEKKYALGAFMTDPQTGKRYQRRKFMKSLGGYAPFKALWAKTFYHAAMVLPTASVSVKGESLPPRKWMEDKVRTVVGSPISQYILSTIWNYGPNHRFTWESTPIKIGMPLNGGTMGQIWANHSRCQLHVEGDFTSFDSTLSGKLREVIASIRKRGFENHSDSKRIADLIDINYDQVNNQLLNTHSNGNVYTKGTGLTTGHSSTSMDNSVALVVLYLMAWKEITGLSAREFKFYNELSCFGDDHFISILGFHPSGWTPTNIRKTMARWGVENNLIVKPLHEIEFLAKFCKRPNSQMRAELDKAGLRHVTMAVWHNKSKLIGKLTSQVKTLNPVYKVERLRSYLGLTAHHEDIYNGIVKYLTALSRQYPALAKTQPPLPSYKKVLADWYTRTSEQLRSPHFEDEKDEMEHTGKMCHYGEVTAIDSILGTVSLLPDVLNPTIFNYGYHRILQARLRHHLAWIYDFIVLQNSLAESGAVKFALSRTPYRFLEPELFVLGDSGANMTEMLVRHWAFIFMVRFMPRFRPPAVIDFIVRRFASTQFAMNGKLQSEMATSNPFFMQVGCAVIVSFIHVPDWFPFMARLRLPDLNAMVQLVSHLFMVTVWQNVPALYQEVERGMKHHDWSKGPILVEAGTGTGKSTDLVLFMAARFGHVYNKIILIVPRTALAVSLVAYLSKISTLSISGSCEGLNLDRNAKVWVVTDGSFWQLVGNIPGSSLIMFDESHIIEERHTITKMVAIRNKWPMIMTTATPSITNLQECGLHLKLNAANLFSRTDLVFKPVAELVSTLELNKRLVPDLLSVAAKLRPNNRVLFFVNTVEQANTLARIAPRRTAVLVSGVPIDTTFSAQWFVSTTVADVGLTIPELDVVVTPNVTPWGKGKLVRMSNSLYKQRAGRTGRTNNGIVYLIDYNVNVEQAPTNVAITSSVIQQLLPSGLPVSLVAKIWPAETFEALGVPETVIDPTAKNKILVSADFMLKTLAPFSRNMREAALGNNPLVGDPFWPEPGTHDAPFSRSHPQDEDEWNRVVVESLQFVLSESQCGSDPGVVTGKVKPSSGWVLPDHFTNGSTFNVTNIRKVCQSVLSMWRNPETFVAQAAKVVPSRLLDEVQAALEIKKTLSS